MLGSGNTPAEGDTIAVIAGGTGLFFLAVTAVTTNAAKKSLDQAVLTYNQRIFQKQLNWRNDIDEFLIPKVR